MGWLLRLAILTESLRITDLPHPGIVQIFVWHKPYLCPLVNREVQSAKLSRAGCWDLQYRPNSANSCLVKITLLSVGKQIGAEYIAIKVWLLRLSISTESSIPMNIPHPGILRIVFWHKPQLYLLGKREVKSAEMTRAGCWDLRYWPNPHKSNIPRPGLAWIIIWHKPQFYPLGNREVQRCQGLIFNHFNVYRLLARVVS